MIVSLLQGGIGNQLFQIVASVGAAEFYGNTWKVQSDFTGKDYFNIPKDRYVDEYALPRYRELHFHYQLIPNGNFQLFGYFQSYRFFKHADKTIREIFKPNPNLRIPLSLERDIAIHVRGTDYLQLKDVHFNLDESYYRRAIKLTGAKPENTIVFTDHYEHAEKLLGNEWLILSGNWWEDFFLMQRCKTFIIANSTFSWWAAYLANGKVIAPKEWFAEKKKHFILDDLYLPEWTVI